MSEPEKALATTIRVGDTFKHASKVHTANKVSHSVGEVWVQVTLGDSGDHRLVLRDDQEIEIISRAPPEEESKDVGEESSKDVLKESSER